MNKRVLSLVTALSLAVSVFTALPANAADATVVRLNPSEASPFNNGEFQGWGTSMGWWGNRIGYSDTLAKKAAELFYSESGLGLDIVRYNVGGGDDPTHNHVTRSDSKLPCFAVPRYDEDGNFVTDENGDVVYDYNWDNDYNQVNVLKEIKKQNDNVHIEGYTNSPPWFMTNTKCSGGGTIHYSSDNTVSSIDENLDPENYDIFADFIADVTEHFEEEGLKFDSYSPMNEPNPKAKYWGEKSVKQEGNHVAPGDNQSNLIIALADEYAKRDIDTMVVGMDETSIDYSISSFNSLSDEAKSKLGRLDTHAYSGSNRSGLKSTAVTANKNLWMSEVDHGGTSGTGAGDMGMALDLAGYILKDMNGMQPSAWVMWDIIDKHKDANFTAPDGTTTEKDAVINQSDGLWGVGMADHDNETIELTQKYYGYGQFTKFIKPGMTIIASSSNTVAAYDKDTGEIVIVAVNFGASDETTTFDMRDFARTGTEAKVIRTSGSYESGEHWARLDDIDVGDDKMFTADLKANSITTFIIDTDYNTYLTEFTADENGLTYKYDTPSYMDIYDKYFAIYKNGALVGITINENQKTLEGDYKDCTAKLFVWDGTKPLQETVSQVIQPEQSLPIPYMTISGDEKLTVGDTSTYTAVNVVKDQAIEDTFKWSVSDENVATVTQDGTVTALKAGTVTLTATSEQQKNSTAIEITVADYSQKYSGTEYKLVSNIEALTNDFKNDLKGFAVSGFAGLSTDNDGEPVLMPQNSLSNNEKTQREGSATLTLENPVSCDTGKIINMAFDMFTPNSDGDSTFDLQASDGSNIVNITVNNWGNTYAVKIGDETVVSDGDGATYFKNNIDSKVNTVSIKNGGHTEIYYTPSSGEVTVMIKNVTNNAETKTYKGTTNGKDIKTVKFAGTYTAWNKQMAVDNLVTNIISEAAIKGTVSVTGNAKAGEQLTANTNGMNAEPLYQWQANTGANGAYEDIDGANQQTYTISDALVGKNIKCVITADGMDGAISSEPTIAVIGSSESFPTLSGTLSVTGTTVIGETLTASVEGLSEGATAKYQWQIAASADGVYEDIDGENTNTLNLTDDYMGKYVICTVTADNFDGSIKWAANTDIYFLEINGETDILTNNEYKYTAYLNKSPAENVTWDVIGSNAEITDAGVLTVTASGAYTVKVTTTDGRTTSLDVDAVVKHITELTNDFSDGTSAFTLSGTAGYTQDASGNEVLGVQSDFDNKKDQGKVGAAVFTSDTAFKCDEGDMINIGFDYYCSNSGGTADIILGTTDTDSVKLQMLSWDHYTVQIGSADAVTETNGAKIYLRNAVNDKTADQLISNGAHIEIYYTPSSGDVVMTVSNNTNTSAETQTYTGNIGANADVSRLAFNADFTTWSKPVYVDNIKADVLTANTEDSNS